METMQNTLGMGQQGATQSTQADKQAGSKFASATSPGESNLSDTPILGDASTAQVTSQPAATTPHVVQSQKVPAEAVPVTPAKASGKTGPQGMPEGYSGQEVNNPDNIEMKHAGNMGNFRNIGTHKNEGIGTNSEPDYMGNTNASGVTDKTGQPLKGTPMVGTDGDMIGGSMKQSEKGRTKHLYNNHAV